MNLHRFSSLCLGAVVGVTCAATAMAADPAPAAPAPAPAAAAPAPVAAPADATPAAAPVAAPVASPAASGPAKLWPRDQSWPKTGKVLNLPILDVQAALPAHSPNTYEVLPELPGDGRDSHLTRLKRTSPGAELEITIRFTGLQLSSIFDPCGDLWQDFPGVAEVERDDKWAPRFNKKMGRLGQTTIACIALKQDKRMVYTEYRAETATHYISGRKYQLAPSVGAAFQVAYAGDFNSEDFLRISEDLEALAGAVHERHGGTAAPVAEAYAAYSTLGGFDHANLGGTGDRVHGIKIRTDLTPFRGFPYSVMTDIGVWGGNGNGALLDLKLGLGLGYFIADLVAISVHGTAGMEGGAKETGKLPLLVTYGANATVAVNITQYFRLRGYVMPSNILMGLGDPKAGQKAVKEFQTKKSMFGFDEVAIGGQLEWSFLGRSAANGGSKGSAGTFYVGFEQREQFLSKMTGIFVGYGAATGSYRAPSIDPLADPRADMSLFQK